MSNLSISLALGVVAGLANVFGGVIVTARAWSRTFLAYFIALGSGFMLATALTEMIPESIRIASPGAAWPAPLLILIGYFIVHFFEHTWPAHFHFGEETHPHAFFDGVAIASGFLVSRWLGAVIFGAVILHNVPEGFTMASIMSAAGKSRRAGLGAVTALAVSRILGILAMELTERFVSYGLALSGGVTLYVAASDLIPEVNKMRGLKIALTVAAGVGMVILLRWLFFG